MAAKYTMPSPHRHHPRRHAQRCQMEATLMKIHIHKFSIGVLTFTLGILATVLAVQNWNENLEQATLFFFIWFYCMIPAALLSSPFWFFGRRRAGWLWWEFSILILPYFVWCVYGLMRGGVGKSIANLFAEPLLLGCLIPFAPLIRVAFGNTIKREALAGMLITLFCLIAIAIYIFVPILPE